jgi:hypothetical protein
MDEYNLISLGGIAALVPQRRRCPKDSLASGRPRYIMMCRKIMAIRQGDNMGLLLLPGLLLR